MRVPASLANLAAKTPSGWAPAAGADATALGFSVRRSGPSGNLPVYSDFRNGRTRQLTLVRRVEGNTRVR